MQPATSMNAIVDAFSPKSESQTPANESGISRALQAVRKHLGMEVAYISEFVGNRTFFREVDAPGLEALIKVGDSHSLDDVYCRHIIEGRLPNVMPDTSAVPFAKAMPITAAVPIGKHISIPLRLADGEVYGMFCCLGPAPDGSLNDRDLNTMKVFAEFAEVELQRDIKSKRVVEEKMQRLSEVIKGDHMSVVYQPIYGIKTQSVAGFECLARFATTPYRTPDVWFKEAAEIDLGAELERCAVALALQGLTRLPDHVYLAVNMSPETALSSGFPRMFQGVDPARVVLEITEHAQVDDYAVLNSALAPLRNRGMRLAVDDAGSGYSSLQHILQLRPDVIKLDISLTRNVDTDLSRRALAAAFISFARATGSKIVAEGVETASELAALTSLGIHMAQGYFLGKPMPLDAAADVVQTPRSA